MRRVDRLENMLKGPCAYALYQRRRTAPPQIGKEPRMGKIIEPSAETAQAIRELYAVTNRLGELYPGRHFTPDGHMVGSLGEVVAAEHYGLDLLKASAPVHDAKELTTGRPVQIKATQGRRVALYEEPDYLIVMLIHGDGSFEEVYNGPGKEVWEAAGKPQKTSQRSISLAKLRELNAGVNEGGRIGARRTAGD